MGSVLVVGTFAIVRRDERGFYFVGIDGDEEEPSTDRWVTATAATHAAWEAYDDRTVVWDKEVEPLLREEQRASAAIYRGPIEVIRSSGERVEAYGDLTGGNLEGILSGFVSPLDEGETVTIITGNGYEIERRLGIWQEHGTGGWGTLARLPDGDQT